MDEIDALTKRFKDYIDKVQSAVDSEQNAPHGSKKESSSRTNSSGKLYTIISPVEEVTDHLKSVLKAIDNAIDHIDGLSEGTSKSEAASKEVYSPEPRSKKFSEEELNYLVETFNKVLKKSEEERKVLFSHIDNSTEPAKK